VNTGENYPLLTEVGPSHYYLSHKQVTRSESQVESQEKRVKSQVQAMHSKNKSSIGNWNWKAAAVIPLFKGGYTLDPNCYRPTVYHKSEYTPHIFVNI
jgi:hypothetical protein